MEKHLWLGQRKKKFGQIKFFFWKIWHFKKKISSCSNCLFWHTYSIENPILIGIAEFHFFSKMTLSGQFWPFNRRSTWGSTHRGLGGSEFFDKISVTDWYWYEWFKPEIVLKSVQPFWSYGHFCVLPQNWGQN